MNPDLQPSPEPGLRALIERLEQASALLGGERLLLGIAGSPGSGKTTLAARLADGLNQRHPGRAAVVPMDGFHLANATLDRLERHDRKGAPDTFDAWGYVAMLQRARSERDHPVYLPSFRRKVDEPIASELAIDVGVDIVITEGNYLLLDQPPWNQVPQVCHQIWFVDTPVEVRVQRLIARHVTHGRTPDAAREWAHRVDGANAALIEPTRARADLVVPGTERQQ